MLHTFWVFLFIYLMKIEFKQDYDCYFDGACDVNPFGNCGTGSIIFNHKDEVVFEHSSFIPACNENSNNVAEHLALTKILEYFDENNITNKKIKISGDSKLVIMQMLGYWRMKEGLYLKYAKYNKILFDKLSKINTIYIQWIPRDCNIFADDLSKQHFKTIDSWQL
jgi:ribonuclease HI